MALFDPIKDLISGETSAPRWLRYAAIGAATAATGGLAAPIIGALAGTALVGLEATSNKRIDEARAQFYGARQSTFRQLQAGGATPDELRAFSLDANVLNTAEDAETLAALSQEHLAKLKGRTGAEALTAGKMLESRVNLFEQLSKPQNTPFVF